MKYEITLPAISKAKFQNKRNSLHLNILDVLMS